MGRPNKPAFFVSRLCPPPSVGVIRFEGIDAAFVFFLDQTRKILIPWNLASSIVLDRSQNLDFREFTGKILESKDLAIVFSEVSIFAFTLPYAKY